MTQARTHRPAARKNYFRFWFWLAVAVLFCIFISLIHKILLPFVVGILTAYFLDPAVRALRGRGWPRGYSAAFITVTFFTLAIGVCVALVPMVIHQLATLLTQLPDYIDHLQSTYSDEFDRYMSLLSRDQIKVIKGSLGSAGGPLANWTTEVAGGLLRSGLAFLNILSLIFITPIVAFYLLRDWHVVVSRFYTLLPRDQAATIRDQLREVDSTLSGFLRGQTNVCLIMAVYYGILLSIVGLNFGLLIGIASGLLLFIPFVGFISCFVLSTVVALFQFPDSAHLLAVLAIYGVGLALENSFLIPRLVGGNVGLHPLWIIFGMLAGGAVFGFVGILISVPLTAVIGVLVRFLISHYMRSSIYKGEAT